MRSSGCRGRCHSPVPPRRRHRPLETGSWSCSDSSGPGIAAHWRLDVTDHGAVADLGTTSGRQPVMLLRAERGCRHRRRATRCGWHRVWPPSTACGAERRCGPLTGALPAQCPHRSVRRPSPSRTQPRAMGRPRVRPHVAGLGNHRSSQCPCPQCSCPQCSCRCPLLDPRGPTATLARRITHGLLQVAWRR